MRPLKTRFRYGFTSFGLALPLKITRRLIRQKARGQASPWSCPHGYSPSTGYRQTISGSISLPSRGFFSPFPHGTCSLSVSGTYLALEDGPPRFPQPFTWAEVLGYAIRELRTISATRLSLSMVRLSSLVHLSCKRLIRPPSPGHPHCAPQPRSDLRPTGLGSSPFARRY